MPIIKTLSLSTLVLISALLLSSPARAAENMHEHGGSTFHMFTLETDYGASSEGAAINWEFSGWIGGDDNKLWLKSEGESIDNTLESAEFWALYSRNISTFWDAQLGIRHDTQPLSTTYFTAGFMGLAPYFIETEAHLFISDDGDVSARVSAETDFLITQKLILQPYIEANVFAQDVDELETGAGISDGEIGVQTRYEFTRKFAPYIDMHYERKLGETSSIAKHHGEENDNFTAALGLKLMF